MSHLEFFLFFPPKKIPIWNSREAVSVCQLPHPLHVIHLLLLFPFFLFTPNEGLLVSLPFLLLPTQFSEKVFSKNLEYFLFLCVVWPLFPLLNFHLFSLIFEAFRQVEWRKNMRIGFWIFDEFGLFAQRTPFFSNSENWAVWSGILFFFKLENFLITYFLWKLKWAKTRFLALLKRL